MRDDVTSLMSGTAARRPTVVAVLVGIATAVGLLGVGAGVATMVTAGTGAGGVAVPVVSGGPQDLPVAASAVVHGAGLPGRDPVTLNRDGALVLGVHEGVVWHTRVLAAARIWGAAVAAGVAVLLLVPVLRSTAVRQPFAEHSARRLAGAAAVVLLGWAASSVLPVVAAATVVEGLPPQAGTWEPVLRPEYWPLGVVALLGALSLATWHGRRLAADTVGLV